MRDHTESSTEMSEPKTQQNTPSREQERPRYDVENDEPQICRGVD